MPRRPLHAVVAAHNVASRWVMAKSGFREVSRRMGEETERLFLAVLREGRDPSDRLVAVVNFTAQTHAGYRLGVPAPGSWTERLNTDAEAYGGQGVGNLGRVEAAPVPHHGCPWSLDLVLPPLAALLLKPHRPA